MKLFIKPEEKDNFQAYKESISYCSWSLEFWDATIKRRNTFELGPIPAGAGAFQQMILGVCLTSQCACNHCDSPSWEKKPCVLLPWCFSKTLDSTQQWNMRCKSPTTCNALHLRWKRERIPLCLTASFLTLMFPQMLGYNFTHPAANCCTCWDWWEL